ncbi:LacI family DNA-binding transcriptional regulator [Streptomyces griseiscabiei]|uniref:LacI family DNA-binding transcriptional regulator n=1 Tax=Streptomyces griseiscabiei TaxID=2993540 RepID=A0ABU4LHW1_9ACTN|nr:LacI family DNA-binding transcriptional regulator [Streptomyces griseiscabiei]MBZ3900435.1 LacI family DNA-binding transcriptional regulator [Streptomyces griseiscabiei]MDX2914603.1 LacI family DNA-binding transcriptional regulator [Streptomyces griseiscabiei]
MPHAARPTVTLRDVAAAAGVSVTTASRVLGGSSRTVASEYRQRVLTAAAALRYTADASARAMRRANDSIAVVGDDLTTPSMGMVAAAMERQAREAGAFVTVSSTHGTAERQLETVRLQRALRPRALILTSSRLDANALGGRLLDELVGLENEGGRVVIVGDTDMPFDSISFDNHGAAKELAEYVAELGNQRVAIFAGLRDLGNVSARTAGFVAGLRDGGVEERHIRIVHSAVSRQGGFDAARRLVTDGLEPPQVVLAANDTIAIGAMSAFRADCVAVPTDISVTGFDDIELATDVTPRLTTVSLPLARAGAEAVRLALEPRAEAVHLVMRGQVVVRDSTVIRVI